MADELSGRTAAFLVANEGIEQIELTEPWQAVEAAGGQPVLLAPKAGSAQAMNHLDKADSFEVDLDVAALGDPPVHAAFIRAPLVEQVGSGVEALATLSDGRVVAVRQGALLGTSFHPEVTGERRFHALLLDLVGERVRRTGGAHAAG